MLAVEFDDLILLARFARGSPCKLQETILAHGAGALRWDGRQTHAPEQFVHCGTGHAPRLGRNLPRLQTRTDVMQGVDRQRVVPCKLQCIDDGRGRIVDIRIRLRIDTMNELNDCLLYTSPSPRDS